MLKLFGNPHSRTFRVTWMLEELALEYEYDPAKPRSPEITALNPLGKIPVLMVGSAVLTDSTAILTYLADKHQKFTFPAGTLERAKQDSHTNFVLDEFDACLWTAARNSFVLPEERRVSAIKDTLKWEFAISQRHFVGQLGAGPFLMGETMTIADIIAVHCAGWATAAKFPITEPAFAEYAKRLRNRPAFKRASAR